MKNRNRLFPGSFKNVCHYPTQAQLPLAGPSDPMNVCSSKTKNLFGVASGVSWLLNSVFSFFFLFERREEETNVLYFTGNRMRK